MAVKFPLIMSGVEVRTLEELQKNFDIDAAVDYFKTRKLQRWLEDRYYEEVLDKVELLRENDSNFRQRLCEALGVDYNEDSALNEKRLKEKRDFLMTQTKDSTIINNANITALNQEDLADLLDSGKSKIYLYGGNTFSIPMRKTNKHYIGILGTPNIMIAANSQAEIDANNITFENVKLPWTTNTSTKKEYQSTSKTSSTSSRRSANSELIDTFEIVFGHRNVWSIFDKNGKILNGEPSNAQKRMFLKMICDNEYEESDLIHICADEDFTAGWAFTKDSFCVGGEISLIKTRYVDAIDYQHKKKIFYSNIAAVDMKKFNMPAFTGDDFFQSFLTRNDFLQSSPQRNRFYREFVIIDTNGDTWQFYCEPDFSNSNSLNPSDNWDVFDEKSFDDGSFSQFGIKFLPNDGEINEPIIENNTTFKSLTDGYAILSEEIKNKIAKFLNFAKS